MLVLNRKVGERIVIGDDVVITVVSVQGQNVRIGIEAPPSVAVWREELLKAGRIAGGSTPNRAPRPVEV